MVYMSDADIRRWATEFQKIHGRPPTQEDANDYLWSQQFQRTYGRPPSEYDWRAHWFSSRGGQPGRQGGTVEDSGEQTVGDLLGLKFPKQAEQLPTYIRDWVRYLEETIRNNPDISITNPLATTWEEGEELTPFQNFQQETAKRMGLDSKQLHEEDLGKGWQKFIDALLKAPFEAQQNLVSLRWDNDKGWYRTQSPMLRHPGEL